MTLTLDENPRNFFDRVYKKLKREYRDLRRARLRQIILSTNPAPPVQRIKYPYRVHMLVCKRDLAMGICAAKTLVWAASESQPFIFHDDGSLNNADINKLMYHFPGCKVIPYADSSLKVREQFGIGSRLYQYRQKGVLMLKLLDVKLFAETEKVIILDSDIVFFRPPREVFALARTNAPNTFNKDIAPAYMLDMQLLEQITGKPLLSHLNSGLSVIHVNTIDFDRLEKWLSQLADQDLIMHRIEQSLMAMLSSVSPYGTEYFPEAYDVSYFKDVRSSVCKHYVGRIRHGFEMEGLDYLIRTGFKEKWRKSYNHGFKV